MPPFGPIPRVWYVVGGLAACLLFSNGWMAWRQRHATERVQILRDTIRVVDARYTVDTVRLTQRKVEYRTARDTLVEHKADTVLVTRFITAADSALAACDSALRTSERRVALRDTLVKEVVKAVTPKPLQFYGEGGAGWQWKDPVLRGGAQAHLAGPVYLVGEAQHEFAPRDPVGRPMPQRTTLRALVRVVF